MKNSVKLLIAGMILAFGLPVLLAFHFKKRMAEHTYSKIESSNIHLLDSMSPFNTVVLENITVKNLTYGQELAVDGIMFKKDTSFGVIKKADTLFIFRKGKGHYYETLKHLQLTATQKLLLNNSHITLTAANKADSIAIQVNKNSYLQFGNGDRDQPAVNFNSVELSVHNATISIEGTTTFHNLQVYGTGATTINFKKGAEVHNLRGSIDTLAGVGGQWTGLQPFVRISKNTL